MRLLFKVSNVIKDAREVLEEDKNKITNGMTESEQKAYEMGIENAMSIVTAILETSDDDVANVHSGKIDIGEEMDIEELAEFLTVS